MKTTHTVQIVQSKTVDTFDFTIAIDIYVLKVQYCKKQGWMTAWCESGKDIKALLDQNREIRLQRIKDYYKKPFTGTYKEWNYENFEFYFPASTTELRAKKHFKLMAETALLTKFINQ